MTHLVVAMVNDGAGDRLHLEYQQGDSPDDAAARYLAREDRRGTVVYEYAVLAGSASIQVNPQKARA